MKFFKALLLLPILLPCFISCDQGEYAEVILLAGQSNMEGFDAMWSSLSQETQKEYLKGHDNVKISYDCTFDYYKKIADKPNSSNNQFVDVTFGQGRTKDLLGPEVGLAKYLGTHSPNKKYYLIKSCEGMSYLRTDWSNFGHCYQTFAKDVENSINTLVNNKVYFKITAMVWMQGEADSQYEDISIKEYFNNTYFLMKRVIDKFSRYIDRKTFKWIDSGISTKCTTWTHYDIINDAKKRLVNTNDNYRYVTESETLEYGSEYHYSAQSYLELGEAYGKSYLN